MGYRRPRCRISSRTCTRWYLIHSKKFLDWEQTNTEQGTWPTKTMVSVWFIKEEFKKEPYKLRGQVVSSRLEMSLKRKSLARAHALFYKGLKAVKGDESKIHIVHGKIQISFFIGSTMAAKYTPEGEVLQEKDGLSSRKLLQEFEQSSARPFLRPLLTQADE